VLLAPPSKTWEGKQLRRKFITALSTSVLFSLGAVIPVFAAQNSEVAAFTSQTLNTLIIFAAAGSVFFIVYAGYKYITSTGKPEALEEAKTTLRNALIGLVLVLGAAVIQSILSNAFSNPAADTTSAAISLTPIAPTTPTGGLTQVLLDAIAGFLQNIVQSATKPLVDGIISFLTTTPEIIKNSVIFNFWLIILGITDSLFAIVIALLGFHVMSSSTFGFEEIELKHLLPRIGISFLLANTSLFWANWIIVACNTLVSALLHATGGIEGAWILNAFNPATLVTGTTTLITLIFMLLFVILAVVLLLFYITRLIIVALGAVLSPLIFLLWAVPKFSDFAEISIKTYVMMVFSIFVHVVVIQLASAFLTIPGQQGTNSLISILIGVGLFFTLLKTPGILMQLVFFNTGRGMIKKVSGQIMNVISSSSQTGELATGEKVTPRRRVAV